jgi:ABC-type Fe3+-hydroxamate transport system substrate-binding protein
VKRRFDWIVLGGMLLLAACSSTQPAQSAASPQAAQRVVALMPSVVEDLFAIGAGRQVVAVSSFTNDVPQAKALPRVADFSSIDAEKIVALHPDLVIGIPSQDRLVEPLRRAGITVVLWPDDTYAQIFTNLTTAGALTGHQPEAATLIAKLQSETARLRARTRTFARHPSVFMALGSGPIWTTGSTSYIATLIGMAGGRNAATDLHAAYGEYSAEALLRLQPDIIVTDPAIRLDAVLDREPWRSLHAVQQHRVYAVDPAAILQRPGPRYNQGLLWLIDRLAPLAT